VQIDTRAEEGYAASWTIEGTSGEKTVTEAEWIVSTDAKAMLEFFSATPEATARLCK
jgi:hypothetical protein